MKMGFAETNDVATDLREELFAVYEVENSEIDELNTALDGKKNSLSEVLKNEDEGLSLRLAVLYTYVVSEDDSSKKRSTELDEPIDLDVSNVYEESFRHAIAHVLKNELPEEELKEYLEKTSIFKESADKHESAWTLLKETLTKRIKYLKNNEKNFPKALQHTSTLQKTLNSFEAVSPENNE